MNSSWIEQVLYYHIQKKGHQSIIPTIEPPGWWEADVFSLTKAGFFNEFEIKVSKSDFKADFKKSIDGYAAQRFRGLKSPPYDRRATKEQREARKKLIREIQAPILKHDLLFQGHQKGPAYFWFVVPEGLIGLDEVPEYAGLMTIPEPIEKRPMAYWYHPTIVRKAPRLHKEKFEQKRLDKMINRILYRYQEMYFKSRPEMIRRIKDLEKRERER